MPPDISGWQISERRRNGLKHIASVFYACLMEYTRAGKPAEEKDLIDPDLLIRRYYELVPDPEIPSQRVAFGTSGHRGTSLLSSFNEAHIVSISKAIAEIRKEEGVAGPLFIGKDTHALSECAWRSAIEVLAGAGVETIIDSRPYTPTPVISRAIIKYNSDRERIADGIVVTPSHNPPEFGGIKYDSTSGGPAPDGLTSRIAKRANEILKEWKKVKRIPFEEAVLSIWVKKLDYRGLYVEDLAKVIDFEPIRNGRASIGADPLSGASMDYWEAICDKYGIDIRQLSDRLDPTWSFMTLDHDEKIRIDPSSKDAMAGVKAKLDKEKAWEKLDLACATDPDADRFGLITKEEGVLNPNYFLAAAVSYISSHRRWGREKKIGRTIVSSELIRKAAEKYCLGEWEVPAGFKWFVDPLAEGKVSLAGEESAGLTMLCRDGSLWTTDKDGIVADLLAMEMVSCGKSPSLLHKEEEKEFGTSYYRRVDVRADLKVREAIKELEPGEVMCPFIGSESVTSITNKTRDGIKFGGIKVESRNTWFVLRPSGTEAIYKIYAESFSSQKQLDIAIGEAKKLVERVSAKN